MWCDQLGEQIDIQGKKKKIIVAQIRTLAMERERSGGIPTEILRRQNQ